MAELINQAQIEQIKAALKDVTDTFFKTPVSYKLAKPNLDRFKEDNTHTYDTYELKALVEYESKDTDLINQTEQGSISHQRVKVSLNYRDLIPLGLTTGDNFVKMRATTDYMVINGQTWKVQFVGLDGPIEPENVLVIVRGDLEEHKTLL